MISDTRQKWTVLQGAIVMADAGLTCALLRRGASLDAKFSKPGSVIDGLTLVQFAKRDLDKTPVNPDRQRVAEVIDQYQASGSCSE